MKKLLSHLTAITFFIMMVNNVIAQYTLTDGEPKMVAEHLEATMANLMKNVDGLSEEQLNFKSDAEIWSVAECVKHLAISEGILSGVVQMSLDSAFEREVAMTDDQILQFITDRTTKIKTQKPFEPTMDH